MARIPLKYLPIAGIILLLCTIGYFFVKTGYKGVNSAILKEVLSEAGLTGKGFHYSQGNLVIDAEKGDYSQDKQRISFDNVVAEIKPNNSPYTMEVKGNKADYDTNTKVMKLSGNLMGYSNNGYKIFTEYLIYEQKEGILRTNEPIRITGPFFSLSGKGLVLNTEKETFEIISDVTTLFEKGL
jgi:LPS export ABC transporter protein LptC